jgi:hypothetical protein
MTVIVPYLDSKGGGRVPIAQFGSPPEAVHHVGTGIALAARGTEETELMVEVGVGFDAPGRLGERPGSFRAHGTVVG